MFDLEGTRNSCHNLKCSYIDHYFCDDSSDRNCYNPSRHIEVAYRLSKSSVPLDHHIHIRRSPSAIYMPLQHSHRLYHLGHCLQGWEISVDQELNWRPKPLLTSLNCFFKRKWTMNDAKRWSIVYLYQYLLPFV
jgi:hypothetical protein